MKNINNNAPVKCSKSILINARREKVWAVLTGINEWATWQKEISRPLLKGNLATGAIFTWRTGGVQITSTLHTLEAYSRFGWTGKTFGLFAIHNWILKEMGGQTEVAVEESMEGLLARLFKKAFNRNLEKGMHYWLEALKKACEQ